MTGCTTSGWLHTISWTTKEVQKLMDCLELRVLHSPEEAEGGLTRTRGQIGHKHSERLPASFFFQVQSRVVEADVWSVTQNFHCNVIKCGRLMSGYWTLVERRKKNRLSAYDNSG